MLYYSLVCGFVSESVKITAHNRNGYIKEQRPQINILVVVSVCEWNYVQK